MSSIDAVLKSLADRVTNHSETIATEEATKTSIVLPFLQGLGYDVFNPSEVIPEFTADAVGKKGEKVDYAIKLNGSIQILIECKGLSTNLDRKHLSQLFRYFTVTSAKFGILTNGRVFEFYTDLEEPNKLDSKPFFSFDLLGFSGNAISELQKFEKASFDVESILATAERLKYVSAVKKVLKAEIDSPSEPLIKFMASEVHEGRITAQVRAQVESAIKAAFKDIIRDAVQSRLSDALESTSSQSEDRPDQEQPSKTDDIETTQEEIEGMLTIRAIVRSEIASNRVGLRDSKSYCAVLVDDNNRKPLCRLHFNRKQWYLGLFDSEQEERVPIASLDEIYNFADRLRATAKRYRD